jgi:hypothetical protein
VGLELEFAVENGRLGYHSDLPTHLSLWEHVQSVLGPSRQAEMWPSFRVPDQKLDETHWQDPRGRKWVLTPEKVQTSKFDGYELVTPPLRSEAELQEVTKVLQSIESAAPDASGSFTKPRFVKGAESSLHVTLDVSDWIGPRGEIDGLVNRMVWIENHWPEIYQTLQPQRMGSMVNGYAVPLAADQPGLLQELAQLSPESRTVEAVAGLFRRYDEVEKRLVHGRHFQRWKFRAANYGKLLGIHPNPLGGPPARPIPIIEFRINDLPSSADLPKIVQFWQRLMDPKTVIPSQIEFRPWTKFSEAPSRKFESLKALSHDAAKLRPREWKEFQALIPETHVLRGSPGACTLGRLSNFVNSLLGGSSPK